MERCIRIYSSNLKQLGTHDFTQQPFMIVEGEIVDYGYEVKAPGDGDPLPTNFPHCCAYHKGYFDAAARWFLRFPTCCEGHQEIAQRPWFSKEKYRGLPLKMVTRFCYVQHHIEKQLSALDWYADITDYLEYVLESFGTPSIGADRVASWLKQFLAESNTAEWTAEKRQRLLEYIRKKEEPSARPRADLNQLYATFQKWLAAVPDLVFFRELKQQYTGKVPIDFMLHSPEYNRYSGLTKSKVRTRGELVEELFELTKQLLASVQSAQALRTAGVSNLNNHQIQLIGERHRLKQDKLLRDYTKGEVRYLNLMRKWLRHEQELVVRLKPLLPPIEMPELLQPTQENMTIAQKINKLQLLLDRAALLENTTAVSSEFKAWRELTTRTLEQLYGADSRPAQHFAGLRFLPVTAGRMVKGSPAYQEEKPKVFKKSLRTAVMVFTDYLRELQDELDSTPNSVTHGSIINHSSTKHRRLFISHAAKDHALVEEFVELLETMGLTKNHIFCSSMPGYGIPLGENFLERLKQELSGEVMVLFLLTPNFFASKICLCEMGATWVLSQSHVPVVVPPLEYKDIQGVIPLTQGFKVDDKLKLNELAIQIAERFDVAGGPRHDDQWERKRDKVLARIQALIKA